MAKINRIYRLLVQLQDENGNPIDEAIEITNPIGINFVIERGIYAQQQTMDIDIFNLNDFHKRMIFRDVYKAERYLYVQLDAGYSDIGMSTIYSGFVWSAYTKREGVNSITHIRAITNIGIAGEFVKQTLISGVTAQDVVDSCMEEMPFFGKGVMSIPDITFTKPVTLLDNPMAIMKVCTAKEVFIDLMDINVLSENEAFIGIVPKINSDAGLLGVPERRDATLTIKMMFEPRLLVGQIIDIESSVAPEFNGQFKIFGIRHEGSINVSDAGPLVTTLQMNVGSQVFGRFNVIA